MTEQISTAKVYEIEFDGNLIGLPTFLQTTDTSRFVRDDILMDVVNRWTMTWDPDNKHLIPAYGILGINKRSSDRYPNAFEYFAPAITKLMRCNFAVSITVSPSDAGLRALFKDKVEERAFSYTIVFESLRKTIWSIDVRLCDEKNICVRWFSHEDEIDEQFIDRVTRKTQDFLTTTQMAVQFSNISDISFDDLKPFLVQANVIAMFRCSGRVDKEVVDRTGLTDLSLVAIIPQEEFANLKSKVTQRFSGVIVKDLRRYNQTLHPDHLSPFYRWRWEDVDGCSIRPPRLMSQCIDVVICLYSFLCVYELLPIVDRLPRMHFLDRKQKVALIETTLASIKSICDKKDEKCANVRLRIEE